MRQQPKTDWVNDLFARAKEVGMGRALLEIHDADGRVKTDLKDWSSAPASLHLDKSPPKRKP